MRSGMWGAGSTTGSGCRPCTSRCERCPQANSFEGEVCPVAWHTDSMDSRHGFNS